MKRANVFATLVLVLAAVLLACPGARADTITAASAGYADVSAAVSASASGDVVVVPAGSAVWTETLNLTWGITLQGAGADATTITGDVGADAFLVDYAPDNPGLDEPFRLTGFTFDLAGESKALHMENTDVAAPLTAVRVDHNAIINCPAAFWVIRGPVYGVADNNTFSGDVHMDNYGLQVQAWENLTFTAGTAENFYYEDNTFNTFYTIATGGHGGRYCYRYNTFNLLDDLYPMWDAHGNQTSGVYATMGIEIYGNLINGEDFNADLCDRRGGKAMIFYNAYIGTGSAFGQSREEYADTISPPAESPIDGTPQHISDSYYWNNRENADLVTWPLTQNCCATTSDELSGGCPDHQCSEEEGIQENREWWNHQEPFDGTVGMGCGPLSQRPASCTAGTGYWATDQSCTDLAGMVGASPENPIAGTFYKCTETDTWTEYYVPLAYPHPLRGAGTPCADLGGACCDAGQVCAGGSFSESSDCGSLCCVGGACENAAEPMEDDAAEPLESDVPDAAADMDAASDMDVGDGGEDGDEGGDGC
jgi:hypothetical protein